MQATRVCPEKVCEKCDGCVADCKSFLEICNTDCTQKDTGCAANCTAEYKQCSQDSVPCAIPSPISTPAPLPDKKPRDLALINELMKEALSLSNGVYFSTAPHQLPYHGVTTIGKGEFLQSPSGLYVFQFLDNGDLGVFAGNTQLWQASLSDNRGDPGHVEFDPKTGVMAMYSSAREEWWNSLTVIRNVRECGRRGRRMYCRMVKRTFANPSPNGKSPYRLVATDNGNVEIVDSNGKIFFETATSERGLLIADVTATADYATGTTTPSNIIPFLGGEWSHIPVDVRIMFEMASYAGEDQWKIFSINFAPSKGIVEEWVGATKIVNGMISLLYIHVKSVGTPVQQYTPVHIHACHRCWFHTSCSDSTTNVPRGFEADELVSMVISLRRAGFFALQNIISTL